MAKFKLLKSVNTSNEFTRFAKKVRHTDADVSRHSFLVGGDPITSTSS